MGMLCAKIVLSLASLRYYALQHKMMRQGVEMMYFLILLGVLLNAAAQLLLKAGMNQIGHFEFSLSNLLPISLKVMVNAPIILGLFAYVVSVAVWLLVLSRVQVSFAYPMLSIGYIVSAIAAYYLLGEDISILRMTGIVIIMAGVFMVSQSSGA